MKKFILEWLPDLIRVLYLLGIRGELAKQLADDTWWCYQCGKVNNGLLKVCPFPCETRKIVPNSEKRKFYSCPECEAATDASAKFCTDCGAKF